MIDDATIKLTALPRQWNGGMVEGWTFNTEEQLLDFARAIEQLARQQQREEDAQVGDNDA